MGKGKGKWSRSVVSDSLRPRGLQPTRLLRPWVLQARVLEWGAIALTTKTTQEDTALTPNILPLPLWFLCWWHSPTQPAAWGPSQPRVSRYKRRLEGQRFNQGSECLPFTPATYRSYPGSWRRSRIFACAVPLVQNALLAFQGLADIQFSSVQSLSRVRLFVTPWIAARQASLSITNSPSSPKFLFHRVGDAIQPSHPLSSPSPPAPNPSQHQSLFQWVNCLHEVAKVLEFQL